MFQPIALLEGIGGPELLFIGILALLMFGSKRLPELGRSFGRAIREFKRATSGVEENLREVLSDEPTPKIRTPRKPSSPGPKPSRGKTEPLHVHEDSSEFPNDVSGAPETDTPVPSKPRGEPAGSNAPASTEPSDSESATKPEAHKGTD